jgi:hypothetical protein
LLLLSGFCFSFLLPFLFFVFLGHERRVKKREEGATNGRESQDAADAEREQRCARSVVYQRCKKSKKKEKRRRAFSTGILLGKDHCDVQKHWKRAAAEAEEV